MIENDSTSWTFGKWDASIHSTPDQLKRIASAKKADTSPSFIDKEAKKGIFPSSGKNPYQTTLDSCTCVDFSRRKLPCKHMYRLAMECGDIEGAFSKGENKNTAEKRQMTLPEVVAEIELLTEKQQKTICHILYEILFHKADFVEIEQNAEISDLVNSPLILHVGSVDSLTILNRMRKKDITALLDKHSSQYDVRLKKNDLALWCVENAPEIMTDIPKVEQLSFVETFRKAQRKVYSYLLRKYDWEYCFEGNTEYRYPHGAIGEDVTMTFTMKDGERIVQHSGNPRCHWFPNDDITALLTQYGCNRCLNGFILERVTK